MHLQQHGACLHAHVGHAHAMHVCVHALTCTHTHAWPTYIHRWARSSHPAWLKAVTLSEYSAAKSSQAKPSPVRSRGQLRQTSGNASRFVRWVRVRARVGGVRHVGSGSGSGSGGRHFGSGSGSGSGGASRWVRVRVRVGGVRQGRYVGVRARGMVARGDAKIFTVEKRSTLTLNLTTTLCST